MKRQFISSFLLLIFAFCLPFAAHANEDERQVVVTGVGMNEEEAKRQAYRNAVQSVVGAMVVAETLVENNALVRDKVLSHSDGYITKTEQIGQSVAVSGGLVEVTMRVTVKSQQLREKLQAENISVIAMDGESLFTKVATQQEQARDAASIVADALKNSNIPASLTSSAANIGQAEVSEAGGAATVKVPITVTVNMDAYRKFVNDLKKTLTDLGFKGETITLPLTTYGRPFYEIQTTQLPWDVYEKLWDTRSPSGEPPVYVITICEMYSVEAKQARFTFFKVPKNLLEVFAPMSTNVEINAGLLDGSQNLITSQTVTLTVDAQENPYEQPKRVDLIRVNYSYSPRDSYGMAMISPALRTELGGSSLNMAFIPVGNAGYVNGATIFATFVLSSDELRAAKSIQTNAQNVGK